MKGIVDDQYRALLQVSIRKSPASSAESITVWIDTAFDGHLVFSQALIRKLQLESLVETEAILADGQKVVLETFLGYVEWFGALIPLQVIANDGKFPLLGTQLLAGRSLHIEYGLKTLNLS